MATGERFEIRRPKVVKPLSPREQFLIGQRFYLSDRRVDPARRPSFLPVGARRANQTRRFGETRQFFWFPVLANEMAHESLTCPPRPPFKVMFFRVVERGAIAERKPLYLMAAGHQTI